MYSVVSKLPKGVTMSKHFEDKVSKRREGKRKFRYIEVLHFGSSYYIPITAGVWKAFGLKDKIHDVVSEDGAFGLDFDVGKAVGDIVGAIQLQVRCDVLNGIEQSVIQHVNENLAKIMHEPLRKELEKQATEKAPRLLEEPK